MALTHTVFLFRLFLLRRGGAWNSQKRQSHAGALASALAAFWPAYFGRFSRNRSYRRNDGERHRLRIHGRRRPRLVRALRGGDRGHTLGGNFACADRRRPHSRGNGATDHASAVGLVPALQASARESRELTLDASAQSPELGPAGMARMNEQGAILQDSGDQPYRVGRIAHCFGFGVRLEASAL